jgi:hypothetical protein
MFSIGRVKIVVVAVVVVVLLVVSWFLGVRVLIYFGDDMYEGVRNEVFTNLGRSVNIPYGVDILWVSNPLCIYRKFYYSLDGVNVFSIPKPTSAKDSVNAIESLVSELSSVKFVGDRLDPTNVIRYGANCQSMAITIRVNLNRLGVTNGYLEYPSHIANWAKVGNSFYLLDIFNDEVRVMEGREVDEYIG